MQVVSVFFTIVLIVFVAWLVVDTIRLFIRKYKERKSKKENKDTDNADKSDHQ